MTRVSLRLFQAENRAHDHLSNSDKQDNLYPLNESVTCVIIISTDATLLVCEVFYRPHLMFIVR